MVEVAAEQQMLIESMTGAFARGDNAIGEDLLARALDSGVPWDIVTVAAAQGVSLRYGLSVAAAQETLAPAVS